MDQLHLQYDHHPGVSIQPVYCVFCRKNAKGNCYVWREVFRAHRTTNAWGTCGIVLYTKVCPGCSLAISCNTKFRRVKVLVKVACGEAPTTKVEEDKIMPHLHHLLFTLKGVWITPIMKAMRTVRCQKLSLVTVKSQLQQCNR